MTPDGEGVNSAQALADPFDSHITLASDFFYFGHLNSTITDTHFMQRDRMGRLVAFLARIVTAGHDGPMRGVGVSEHSAVRLDQVTGLGQVSGNGPVYFLDATAAEVVLCEAGKPLQVKGVRVQRWTSDSGTSAVFDFTNGVFLGGNITKYTLSADKGKLTSSNGHIY